jgi:hypothetical protein
MGGRPSTARQVATGWRLAAGFLLVMEALWWAINVGILATAGFGESATAELLSIIPVALMMLTFLAVFLLIQAPRGGVWMGLGLQGVVGVHAVVLAFVLESLGGAFELALGVGTAICLAAAAQEISKDHD